MKVLESEVIHHNARTGRRAAVCAGRSFDEAFNESYQTAPIRKATEDQRRLWLLAAEQVTAQKPSGAIRFYGNEYWCERMAQIVGERVVVRFDPQRLQEGIYDYRADGVYLGLAPCTWTAGFADTDSAREYNQARNKFKSNERENAALEIRMSVAKASAMVTSPTPTETPNPKLVRPIFEKPAAVGSEVLQRASGQDIWEQDALNDNIRALHEEFQRTHIPD